ncbi:PREDICTED: nitric oxide-associated protein 1 [Thamnophis sirtalis]|uniref:Nitric oxide-associated protein 1 n=1 Tax=Thamnophis sirtalis TaxID=35019 RepID=A0A6I9XPI7_9SAUR|nr:PREDICTED: nitric oxide-associated protein 1 [Thamnophis sirtalis]
MNVFRRIFAGGLPRFWRPLRLSEPACGKRIGALLCRTSVDCPPHFPLGKEPRGRWGEAAVAVSPELMEQEEFVFPEYIPEELSLDEEKRLVEAAVVQELEQERPKSGGHPQQPREGRQKAARSHQATGRPDASVRPSGVSCSGCGAELHCRDPAVPGYLPSEKYLSLLGPEALLQLEEDEGKQKEGAKDWNDPVRKALEGTVCQRCWLLMHHHQALKVEMSREAYYNLVSAALKRPPRHGRSHLVLCMVDLLDLPDSILPDLSKLVGTESHIFVLGNKVDLLPADSPKYLKHLQELLLKHCEDAGLVDLSQPSGTPNQRIIDVHLISAKTGYGIETLISKLQQSWKLNGDVYLVGAANSGKSSLFNTLLHSDYCKSKASDVIHRATISPFPGTTLNLLKFPIINPTPYRVLRRQERLKEDSAKSEEDLSINEQKQLNILKKQGYLIGRIGRTFKQPEKKEKNIEIDFDFEALSMSMEEEPSPPRKANTTKIELTYNEVKDCRWFHDTPGIIKDECVLNLLTEKEIKYVLPTIAIVPRTFILKPGTTLFLGALGRIDYLQGNQSSWFSVVASNLLPVHITATEKADAVYQKHAGQPLLKVPMGGEERMNEFPPLVPQEVMLEGIGVDEAIADIKLSSAGWVAVTAPSNNKMQLKCYTPEGTLVTIRKPPLLPYIVHLKGQRVKGSSTYRTKRPPSFVQNLKSNKEKKK